MHFTPPHVSISFQLSFNLAFSSSTQAILLFCYVSLTLVQVKQVSVININDPEHMYNYMLCYTVQC